jgi:hypothetical protein
MWKQRGRGVGGGKLVLECLLLDHKSGMGKRKSISASNLIDLD